uniref:Cytochrome P450 n=1 Tax=Psilocybe cubensis TaxID=181762 RepID=A0A8H7XP39_PSICU
MRIVKELLDDRSSETSSRPYFYALEVLAKGFFFVLATSDNPVWRASRKSIQPFFSVQATDAHVRIMERESSVLLHDVLHNPNDLTSHIIRYTFSSITDLAFGKRVLKPDSPEILNFRSYIRTFAKAVSPEAAPVDLIPILRYVPDFLAPWMKLWCETQTQQRSLYFSFLDHAERTTGGGKEKSIIQTTLEQRRELGLTREMVAYTGGALLDAGTETIATTTRSLLLCLMSRPACLKKAQEEIDDLIGDKRLPLASDIDALPYIQALIKENVAVMRLIWAFDFSLGDDFSGADRPWMLEDDYEDDMKGIALAPKEYFCKVTPRSAERAKVIEDCYNLYNNSDV